MVIQKQCALIAAGLLLGFTQTAWADYEAGLSAFLNCDYETAVREWEPLAEQGDARAIFRMAEAYEHGIGGKREDDEEADRLIRVAAARGHARAQTTLGRSLIFNWWRDAGTEEGQFFDEPPQTQELVEGLSLLRSAADQGDWQAQVSLGEGYRTGKNGVPQDYVLAYMWLNLAVTRGGNMVASARDDVTELMTIDQIAQAQRLTREWSPTLPADLEPDEIQEWVNPRMPPRGEGC